MRDSGMPLVSPAANSFQSFLGQHSDHVSAPRGHHCFMKNTLASFAPMRGGGSGQQSISLTDITVGGGGQLLDFVSQS